MQKNKNQIHSLTYMALYVAMYVVLKFVGDLIPFLNMPNGGSIQLEAIALLLASYHLGWKKGSIVALMSWLITIVLGFPMYFVHPVQVLLDYVLPLQACGLASLFWPFDNISPRVNLILSAVVGLLGGAAVLLSYPGSVMVYIAAALVFAAVASLIWWYGKKGRPYGIVISFLLKYFFTVLSGVYFWAEGAAAGSAAAWAFSLNYNLGYNLMTMAVCVLAVPVLMGRVVKQFMK